MKIYFFLLLELVCINLPAQTDGRLHGSLEVQGIRTSSGQTPFWFHANQYGSIPLPGTSSSVIGALYKTYDSSRKHLVDWGASLEVRADLGKRARATLIEGYGKLRISIFELRAGRSKEIMGLVDTTLSSGAFAISGNALGVPKLQLSIPEYYSLPFWGKLFAFKGNYADGWIGDVPIQYGHLTNHAVTWFHQKSLYGRLGKPGWKLKLYGGFNHQVFWGNEKNVFKNFNLSALRTYEYVVIGKTWEYSKIGNHLGSIDIGAEYEFNSVRVTVYRLNFYDEGALYRLANIRDGLNGVSIVNKNDGGAGFKWHKLLFEFLYSVNQAGLPSSIYTNSGDENYYNNYEYTQGWSYKGQALGTPFLSTRTSTRQGLPNDSSDYFNNNRVSALHLGIQGSVKTWDFTGKFSYSWNYGTYGTSIYGHSTGRLRVPPRFGIFKEKKQFSSFLELRKAFCHGLTFGCVAAVDYGDLLYNSSGLIVKISKTF